MKKIDAKKVVVIGGTGLIGSKVIGKLTQWGSSGGAGIAQLGCQRPDWGGVAEVFRRADVVVDASNLRSLDTDAVSEFFTTSTTNLLTAAKAAGVAHVVALRWWARSGSAKAPTFGPR